MYRPNRIGPHPVLAPGLASLVWPTDWNTNFNGPDSDLAVAEIHPQVRSVTVRDNFDQFNLVQADLGATIAAEKKMSFGVALNGAFEASEPMLVSCAMSVVMTCGTQDCALAAWFGRADGASLSVTRTSQQNDVSNPIYLPADHFRENELLHLDYNGSVIVEDHAGDYSDDNPLLFGFSLHNHSGVASTVKGLHFNLSAHRYVSDLNIFDPNR